MLFSSSRISAGRVVAAPRFVFFDGFVFPFLVAREDRAMLSDRLAGDSHRRGVRLRS